MSTLASTIRASVHVCLGLQPEPATAAEIHAAIIDGATMPAHARAMVTPDHVTHWLDSMVARRIAMAIHSRGSRTVRYVMRRSRR